MIGQEIKKVLFVYKGIVFFALGIVFIIISFRYNNKIELAYKSNSTNSIIKEYSGKLTDEKYNTIEQQYKKYGSDDDYFKKMEMFYSGEINAVEFYKYIKESENYSIYRSAFTQLHEMAKYAKEDENNHYIINRKGWNILFQNETSEAIFVFVLILNVVLFISDTEKPVENLFLTTVNGRRRLLISRISAYAIISFLAIFTYQFVVLLYVHLNYGLYGFSYPVQSILWFQNYSGKISLLGIYILSSMIIYIGVLLTGALVYFTTLITHNKNLCIAVSSFLLFERYFIPAEFCNGKYMYPNNCFNNLLSMTEGVNTKMIVIGISITLILLIAIMLTRKEHGRGYRI